MRVYPHPSPESIPHPQVPTVGTCPACVLCPRCSCPDTWHGDRGELVCPVCVPATSEFPKLTRGLTDPPPCRKCGSVETVYYRDGADTAIVCLDCPLEFDPFAGSPRGAA